MAARERDLEILRHYNRFLGHETRSVRFLDLPSSAPSPILVLEYAPRSEKQDWVYTTAGAGEKAMPATNEVYRSPDERVEFILHADQRNDDLMEFMVNMAIYPFVYGTSFDPGDTVAGGGHEGVTAGSPLTEVLLIRPYFAEPGFEIIHHSDGTHTNILWLVPIYLTERLYTKEHGYRALLKLFGDARTNTSDLWRPPVV